VAAATSTGGTPKKRMGRVGDSPIVGAGAYADSAAAAVSATGWGEPILLCCLSRRVVEGIERGLTPDDAAAQALEVMLQRFEGRGGVILLTPVGTVSARFTTPRMAHAWWRAGDAEVTAAIDTPLQG